MADSIHQSDIDADEVLQFILSADGRAIGSKGLVQIILAIDEHGLDLHLIVSDSHLEHLPTYIYPH